jgi:1-acyl-sn-glycerol-3-phosphate acyltransferase
MQGHFFYKWWWSIKIVRSILFNLAFYTFTLLWATGLLITIPLPGRRAMSRGIWLWTHAVLWMARVIAGITVEVRGAEHLRPNEALIIVSKHMSDLDAIVIFHHLPDMTALAKKELFRVPVIGLLLRKLDIVRIDRQSGQAHQEMPRVIRAIREGKRPLVVFPEGTRTLPGQHRPLKSGAYYLQEDGSLPVVPMATNSGLHWPRGLGKRRPGRVVYIIGAPLAHSTDKAHFMKQVNMQVMDLSDQLMRDDPAHQHYPALSG